MSRWAVVLAGGVGSRFWPLSTPDRPKQLLPLVTDEPLLADAVARLAPLVPPERTLDTHERVVRAADRARCRRSLPPRESHRRAAAGGHGGGAGVGGAARSRGAADPSD